MSEVDIYTIYPPPPAPPLKTDSYRSNKKIDREYEEKRKKWKKGFKEWKDFREKDIIKNRFEILDIR